MISLNVTFSTSEAYGALRRVMLMKEPAMMSPLGIIVTGRCVGCIVTGVAGGRDAVDVAKLRILDFETGKAYMSICSWQD